jgi:dihydrofolate reductase
MQSMDIIWPYKEQTTYVISHYDWGEKENIKFITADVIQTIKNLRMGQGKDILLAGGGEVVSMLLGAGLIDEMRICYVPVTLGRGTPLFPEQPVWAEWNAEESKVHDNGILPVSYSNKVSAHG